MFPALGGTSRWDIAAGQALIESVGGRLTDRHGNLYTYDPDAPYPHGEFCKVPFKSSHFSNFTEVLFRCLSGHENMGGVVASRVPDVHEKIIEMTSHL